MVSKDEIEAGDRKEERNENLHYVASVDEIDIGDRVIVDVEGMEIAVFNVKGDFHGVANYCTHQGGPVCEGPVYGTISVDEDGDMCFDRDGELIVCPWHGWSFDIETGEHISKSQYVLPTYDVVVRDESVYISM